MSGMSGGGEVDAFTGRVIHAQRVIRNTCDIDPELLPHITMTRDQYRQAGGLLIEPMVEGSRVAPTQLPEGVVDFSKFRRA